MTFISELQLWHCLAVCHESTFRNRQRGAMDRIARTRRVTFVTAGRHGICRIAAALKRNTVLPIGAELIQWPVRLGRSASRASFMREG
jgi:hypothetical protein